MIIHCLSCGKSISSKPFHCPYCRSETTALTLEVNGIPEEKIGIFAQLMRKLSPAGYANK